MKKKPRMGRPPLPKGEVRSVFAIRLSLAERERVESSAKAAGMSASEWARATLLTASTLPT